MTDKEKTALVVGGISLAGLGVYLLARKAKAIPLTTISIRLANPPAWANYFQINLVSWRLTEPTSDWPNWHWEPSSLGVLANEAAIFQNVPEDWAPPFFIELIILEHRDYGEADKIQSWNPFYPFDYFDVQIPSFGNFIFDWATKELR